MVDSNFGIGSSNHFAQVIEIVNWDSFFPHLHSLTWSLSDDDKIWLKANCERLFRELLESDGLDPEEESNSLNSFHISSLLIIMPITFDLPLIAYFIVLHKTPHISNFVAMAHVSKGIGQALSMKRGSEKKIRVFLEQL